MPHLDGRDCRRTGIPRPPISPPTVGALLGPDPPGGLRAGHDHACIRLPGHLRDRARYVGPVLDDPTWTERWTPPADDTPLILVGLSSTFQNRSACLQRIADVLGALPVRGLITTGPALDPSALSAPANVAVVTSAPHTQVLHHAAAMVTRGGHGTVLKSLAAGVPMVVLDHGRDQADNAARVTSRGAGIAIKRTAGASTIAAAVEKLFDEPRYRQNAAQLGAAVRRDAASGALFTELEGVGARHASPASSHFASASTRRTGRIQPRGQRRAGV